MLAVAVAVAFQIPVQQAQAVQVEEVLVHQMLLL
jgi:hypothetical protein